MTKQKNSKSSCAIDISPDTGSLLGSQGDSGGKGPHEMGNPASCSKPGQLWGIFIQAGLEAVKDGDCTVWAEQLCLTVLMGRKFFSITTLNLPPVSLCPLPPILSCNTRMSLAPALCLRWPPCSSWLGAPAATGRTGQHPHGVAGCLGAPAHGRGMASAGARAASLSTAKWILFGGV